MRATDTTSPTPSTRATPIPVATAYIALATATFAAHVPCATPLASSMPDHNLEYSFQEFLRQMIQAAQSKIKRFVAYLLTSSSSSKAEIERAAYIKIEKLNQARLAAINKELAETAFPNVNSFDLTIIDHSIKNSYGTPTNVPVTEAAPVKVILTSVDPSYAHKRVSFIIPWDELIWTVACVLCICTSANVSYTRLFMMIGSKPLMVLKPATKSFQKLQSKPIAVKDVNGYIQPYSLTVRLSHDSPSIAKSSEIPNLLSYEAVDEKLKTPGTSPLPSPSEATFSDLLTQHGSKAFCTMPKPFDVRKLHKVAVAPVTGKPKAVSFDETLAKQGAQAMDANAAATVKKRISALRLTFAPPKKAAAKRVSNDMGSIYRATTSLMRLRTPVNKTNRLMDAKEPFEESKWMVPCLLHK